MKAPLQTLAVDRFIFVGRYVAVGRFLAGDRRLGVGGLPTVGRLLIVGSFMAAGLLLAADPPLQAQEAEDPAVTGRVLDARSGAPIRGAFVGLHPAHEGVLTDSTGHFRLPVSVSPPYDLVAEQLGYSDGRMTISAAEVDSGVELRIEPDPVALEELEVVTERYVRERNAYPGAVSAYDQDFMLSQPGQTAFDVAVRRARLRPCAPASDEEWCAVSRGQLVPARVYVDEIPVAWDGVNALRDYHAGEIYLLEVYGFGRVIRVLTRWGVEERPEQIAALRTLPIVPEPWEMNARRGPLTLNALEATDPRQLRLLR
ncbi:MAG: carboxypeptidase-like regulatory domain-containing protein [Longimicrobiales bacterium]